MPAEVRTYEQDIPEDILLKEPEKRWRCDIYPEGGSDHHGIGATEADAMMQAVTHYVMYSRGMLAFQTKKSIA